MSRDIVNHVRLLRAPSNVSSVSPSAKGPTGMSSEAHSFGFNRSKTLVSDLCLPAECWVEMP